MSAKTSPTVATVDHRHVRVPVPREAAVVTVARLTEDRAGALAAAVNQALARRRAGADTPWDVLWAEHRSSVYPADGERMEGEVFFCHSEDAGVGLALELEASLRAASFAPVNYLGRLSRALDDAEPIALRHHQFVLGSKLGQIKATLEAKSDLESPSILPLPPMHTMMCACGGVAEPVRLVSAQGGNGDAAALAVELGDAEYGLQSCLPDEPQHTAKCRHCQRHVVPGDSPPEVAAWAALGRSARLQRVGRTSVLVDGDSGRAVCTPSASKSGDHWWLGMSPTALSALFQSPDSVVALRLRGGPTLFLSANELGYLDPDRRLHLHVREQDLTAARAPGSVVLPGVLDPAGVVHVPDDVVTDEEYMAEWAEAMTASIAEMVAEVESSST